MGNFQRYLRRQKTYRMVSTNLNKDSQYYRDTNSLPLARIKKIMKLDDEVKVE